MSANEGSVKRPAEGHRIAKILRRTAPLIALLWMALAGLTNSSAPQLEKVAEAHNVALAAPDAPSMIAMKHIGKVFSRRAIDALDNGQLADPFLTGGGYNCRHVWMTLSSLSDSAALADTGERVAYVAEALADVQPKKRARAA